MSRAIHSTKISHPPIRHSHHPPSLSTIEIAPNLCMRLLASESKVGRSRGRNFFSDHTLTQSIERKTGRKSGPNFASCPRSNEASERYAICNGTKGRGRGWRNSQSTQNGRKNRIALSEFPNASLVAWGKILTGKCLLCWVARAASIIHVCLDLVQSSCLFLLGLNQNIC